MTSLHPGLDELRQILLDIRDEIDKGLRLLELKDGSDEDDGGF